MRLATEKILSFPIAKGSETDCLKEVLSWIGGAGQGRYVVCANPHSLEMARGDAVFRQALLASDMTLPDGAGIVLASRLLGGEIRKRVTGSDLFWGLSRLLNQRGRARYFFLGASGETLEKIRRRLAEDFPNIEVSGLYSPPFKAVFDEEDNQRMIKAVNAQCPDVLWVGMTAPKQEKWIFHNRHHLRVKVIGAVGAVFDFYSGSRQRSHPFFLPGRFGVVATAGQGA